MNPESDRFVAAVRRHFRPLFTPYGFTEVQAQSYAYTDAVYVARSATQYFRIVADFRDDVVDAKLGHIVEGGVPPYPTAPARDWRHVREISQAFVVWVACGDKARAFALGQMDGGVEAAVKRVADAWQTYGGPLLAGDDSEWERAARLMITRELPE